MKIKYVVIVDIKHPITEIIVQLKTKIKNFVVYEDILQMFVKNIFMMSSLPTHA